MLVTGATSGIGRALARELAPREITLLVHGRDPQKLDDLSAELQSLGDHVRVHSLQADFASLADVRAMADDIKERFSALHVLINNAGVLTDHRQVSRDGFELTFAVNHLAPFLLTNQLLDLLVASAPARIAFNSSSAMGSAALNLDDLQMERHFQGWTAYANTKLANMLVSNLLAERLAEQNVVSNSFCPGLIDTNLLANNRDFGDERIAYMKSIMRTPADGAGTALFLATEPGAQNINGAFFLKSHGAGKTPLDIGWDRVQAEQLWQASEDLIRPWL